MTSIKGHGGRLVALQSLNRHLEGFNSNIVEAVSVEVHRDELKVLQETQGI